MPLSAAATYFSFGKILAGQMKEQDKRFERLERFERFERAADVIGAQLVDRVR
jgi:hypothetical protein